MTTAEYGSQMLSLGGVHHLTGGCKKEGRVTCDTMLGSVNSEAVEIDDRRRRDASSSRPARRRSSTASKSSACGSAAARRRSACSPSSGRLMSTKWSSSTITLPACSPNTRPGSCSTCRRPASRSRAGARRPGRYFQVAEPGTGWGGTDIDDPLDHRRATSIPKVAWPGLRMLMVSTTGEHSGYFVLDEQSDSRRRPMPAPVRRIGRAHRRELRAGAGDRAVHGRRRRHAAGRRHRNPVRLTRSVKEALTRVTCGGAPVYVWPGGGITFMVDVTAYAREFLRLCADAGAGRADRVHHAAATITRRSAAIWKRSSDASRRSSLPNARSRRWRKAPGRQSEAPCSTGAHDAARRRRAVVLSTCADGCGGCICSTGRSI